MSDIPLKKVFTNLLVLKKKRKKKDFSNHIVIERYLGKIGINTK